MNPEHLFATLGRKLLTAIPNAVSRASIVTPLWSLRLYYYDSHAPCAYLHLGTISTTRRDKIVSKHGNDAPRYLWSSADTSTDGPPGLTLPSDQPPPWSEWGLSRLFSKVYRLLGDDDTDYMVHYRAMFQQVAQQLNASTWPASCSITDDFTVVAADGSQYFCDDWQDIVRSIPSERIDLLRSRKYLGPSEDNWDCLQ